MKKNIISKSLLVIAALVATPAMLLATPAPVPIESVPDSGSTLVLITLSILGVFAFRRFKGK